MAFRSINCSLGNSMYSTKWYNQSYTWKKHAYSVLVSVSQWPNDKMETKVMWQPISNKKATSWLSFIYEENIFVSVLKHIQEISHLKVKLLTFELLSWKAKFQVCIKVTRVCKLRRLFDFCLYSWVCLSMFNMNLTQWMHRCLTGQNLTTAQDRSASLWVSTLGW